MPFLHRGAGPGHAPYLIGANASVGACSAQYEAGSVRRTPTGGDAMLTRYRTFWQAGVLLFAATFNCSLAAANDDRLQPAIDERVVQSMARFGYDKEQVREEIGKGCDGTTGDMAICAAYAYHAADVALTEKYRELYVRLEEPTAQEDLQRAQAAWSEYRDAQCRFDTTSWTGGSFRRIFIAICRQSMAEQRLKELAEYLACQSEDCPALNAFAVDKAASEVGLAGSEFPVFLLKKRYRLLDGGGAPLCEALLNKMNEMQTPVCALRALQSISGVSQPGWERLDLQANKELYKKFRLAKRTRPEDWAQIFSNEPPPAGTRLHRAIMPSQIELEADWTAALNAGAEFFSVAQPNPRSDHDDVLLVQVWPVATPEEPGCPLISTHLFTGDKQMPKLNRRHSAIGHVPFSYQGKNYALAETVHSGLAGTMDLAVYWFPDGKNLWGKSDPLQGLYGELTCNIKSN